MKSKFLLISTLAVTSVVFGKDDDNGYVAHEWGTFTSVQGADGIPLDWRPLESSDLPSFVYDWNRPGGERQSTSPLRGIKAQITTLQRMETPVIYFYSAKPQTVDISVRFPTGLITEWYPQAQQIGPAQVVSPFIRRLDQYAQQLGANPQFSFASLLPGSTTATSGATWSQVEVLPAAKSDPVSLPTDSSASHYFAARDTDANCLRVRPQNGGSPEYEKFIFYRGVGNFKTPLQVSVSQNSLVVENSGNQHLNGLFVLHVKNGKSNYMPVQTLKPEQPTLIPLPASASASPWQANEKQLHRDLSAALVSAGLYQREADAMINTWRQSWFDEEGVRVLYILPRAWTDQTLPITLEPKPTQLVRVMIGRAEVLLPETEHRLASMLSSAFKGIEPNEAMVKAELRRLGRFAEPAVRLALRGAASDELDAAMRLLYAANEG